MTLTDYELLLKALREKVVPWLQRQQGALGKHPGDYEKHRCCCCHRLVLNEGDLLPVAMLQALGEEP